MYSYTALPINPVFVRLMLRSTRKKRNYSFTEEKRLNILDFLCGTEMIKPLWDMFNPTSYKGE